MFDIYQAVTDRILNALETGVAPWAQPWDGRTILAECAISHVSGKPYSLLNQLLLLKPGEYCTFKQVKDAGGQVKKGAKARFVVFWKWVNVEDENDPDKVSQIPFLRYYNVFHIEDCEGIEAKWSGINVKRYATEPIEAAETVFTDYTSRENITVKIGDSARAFYRPADDMIRLPGIDQYKNAEEFYSTAFHEATHSTGHEKRLNRLVKAASFGSDDYSKEELVAELGSCFICAQLGISTETAFRNSAAYVQGWLYAMKNDKRLIVSAAGAAEKAAKLILNIKEETN